MWYNSSVVLDYTRVDSRGWPCVGGVRCSEVVPHVVCTCGLWYDLVVVRWLTSGVKLGMWSVDIGWPCHVFI